MFNSTISADVAVSPYGSTTASKITVNTTNVDHITRQPLILGATRAYALLCFAKAAGQHLCKLRLIINPSYFTDVYVDSRTGVINSVAFYFVVKDA